MTQKGDRVELVRCSDPYTKLMPGEKGTVTLINRSSFGTTVFVDWDSGSKLGLVAGEDAWTVIKRAEPVISDGGPYDLNDPKHPTYHDRYADAWDMREGK